LSAARAGVNAMSETAAAFANIHRLFIDLPLDAVMLEKRRAVHSLHVPAATIALFQSNVYMSCSDLAVLMVGDMLFYYASSLRCS
jgi:hypothetical protein